MTIKKPIQFRAVHTKTRWRRASHESVANALGNKRGARALFDHLNKAIDYSKHGEPLYVLIWDERLPGSGEIVKPDHSRWDGLQHAPVSDQEINRFESGAAASDEDLDLFFARANPSLAKARLREVSDGPATSLRELPTPETEAQLEEQLQAKIQDSRGITADARRQRLLVASSSPVRIEVRTTAFIRNADVIVEVLERAAGHCEECRRPAPFVRASDGTPYLEVHHIVPLSKGGNDLVENAQAICPNCHRRKHYAQSDQTI
ncbi:MAG: hypothetical protein CRU78_04285 [Candidatus Accumulibacter phosphatis]|uniref:HNH nuclease domain-containing protein n=1 Tax=Candidatus Accumulibacter phosphatis TaxID=327160 RepID=A0A6A7RQH4_9PROT|nr:hypothetical protein [Candidatus Accumulibacter phosphatis]